MVSGGADPEGGAVHVLVILSPLATLDVELDLLPGTIRLRGLAASEAVTLTRYLQSPAWAYPLRQTFGEHTPVVTTTIRVPGGFRADIEPERVRSVFHLANRVVSLLRLYSQGRIDSPYAVLSRTEQIDADARVVPLRFQLLATRRAYPWAYPAAVLRQGRQQQALLAHFQELWARMPENPDDLPALRWFNKSYYELFEKDGFTDLVFGLESLLAPEGGDNLSHKIKMRGAIVLKRDPTERRDCCDSLRKAYALRSSLVHRGDAAPLRDLGLYGVIENALRECLVLRLKHGQHAFRDTALDDHLLGFAWPPEAQG